jgi:choline-glycine betaine transporter
LHRFRISLGFKQMARGLHVVFGMTGVAAALLAAIAIIGISLCLESSHWVGVDFGRA